MAGGSSSPRTVFCFDDDVVMTQAQVRDLGAPSNKEVFRFDGAISSTAISSETQETTATITPYHYLLPCTSSDDDKNRMSSNNQINPIGGSSNLGSQGPVTLEMVYNEILKISEALRELKEELQEVTMKKARNISRLLNLAIHDENGHLRGHGMLIKSRVTSADVYFLVSCAHVLSKLFIDLPNTTTLRFQDGTILQWQWHEMYAPQAVLSRSDFAVAVGNVYNPHQAKLILHDVEIYMGDLCGSTVLSASSLVETKGSANTLPDCKSKIYVSSTSRPGASGTSYFDAQARLTALVVGARLHSAKLDFRFKTAFSPFNYGVRFPVGESFCKVTRPDIMGSAFQMIDSGKPEQEIRFDLSQLLNCRPDSTIEQFDASLARIAVDWTCSHLPLPDNKVQAIGLPL